MAASGTVSSPVMSSRWVSPAWMSRSRARVSSRAVCSGSRASPERPTTWARLRPWTTRVKTTTAVVRVRTRGRPGSGVPSVAASGMDRAAASGITPRVPAQVTTPARRQDGRPLVGLTAADSGSIHTTRRAIRVAAMASACSGHRPVPAGSSRIRDGSSRPTMLKTTLSSRKITTAYTACSCSRIWASLSWCPDRPSSTPATTTAVIPDMCADSAST